MNQELVNRVQSRLSQVKGIVEKDIRLQNSTHHLNHAFVELAELVLDLTKNASIWNLLKK